MDEELHEHYASIFEIYLDALERLIRARASYVAEGGRSSEVLAAYDEYITRVVDGAQMLRAILEQAPFGN